MRIGSLSWRSPALCAVGAGLAIGCAPAAKTPAPDRFDAVLIAAPEPADKPLVVALHGRGGTAEGLIQTSGLDTAVGADASLLAVQALPIFDGSTGWDLNDEAETARLRATVDDALRSTGADPDRVVLTGYSLGGMMALVAVCDAPDRWAGVALVAGAMETSLAGDCPAQPTPALFFHGRADTAAPWDGTRGTLSVPDMVDFWVAANDCEAAPESESWPDRVPWDGSTAATHTYSGCQGGDVVLFDLADSRHAWPGSRDVAEGSTGINMDVDASAEIVERLGLGETR
jgi:poly(3-hydroxybutyrate) depolymerase